MFAAMLRRHYCKIHMTAYVTGGLSPRARGRIARYIEGDPACYAEYRRQRELASELRAGLPALGAPTPRQLDRVWGAIQAELNLNADRDATATAPAMPYRAAPRRRANRHSVGRYRLAGAALALSLTLPLALLASGGTASARAVPTPPVPRQTGSALVAEIAQTQSGADTLALALPPNATPEAPQAETAQVVTRATPTATQQ